MQPLVHSPEILAQEPLPSFVLGAMEALQRDHFGGGDLPVQIEEHGFGGYAYLENGESLHFTDAAPGSVHNEAWREGWQTKGFTDEEISSGVSKLISWSADKAQVTGRVYIAGLLDTHPGIRVLRQQEDGKLADSDLTQEETTAIVRLAFLSQLVGYISDRHLDESPYGAIDAFVDELVVSSELNGITLDGSRLRDMFNSPRFYAVTIIAGMKRFYNLVGDYRDRVSNFDNLLYARSDAHGLSRLVHSGEYFTRIVASLDLNIDELDSREPVTPRAIESAK